MTAAATPPELEMLVRQHVFREGTSATAKRSGNPCRNAG